MEATLLALAQRCPRAASELEHLPGMTTAQIRRHGAGVLTAVKHGLAAPPPRRPERKKPDPEPVRERYERLADWRKRKAKARGVESDVIMPRQALMEIARRSPGTLQDLTEIEHLSPWRRQAYGLEILAMLAAPEEATSAGTSAADRLQ